MEKKNKKTKNPPHLRYSSQGQAINMCWPCSSMRKWCFFFSPSALANAHSNFLCIYKLFLSLGFPILKWILLICTAIRKKHSCIFLLLKGIWFNLLISKLDLQFNFTEKQPWICVINASGNKNWCEEMISHDGMHLFCGSPIFQQADCSPDPTELLFCT